MTKVKDIKILKLQNEILEQDKEINDLVDVIKLYERVLNRIRSNGWKLEALLGVDMSRKESK